MTRRPIPVARETLGRESLLSLARADFEEDDESGRDANADAAGVLARLDGVIGLAGVKVRAC